VISEVLSGLRQWAIVEGDALALLSSLPENSVDGTVTSPPYNVNAGGSAPEHPNSSRGSGKDFRGYSDDDPDALPEWIYQYQQVQVLDELYRVTRPGGSCFYVHRDRMWDGMTLDPLDWLRRSQWTVRQRITWDRGTTHRYDGWYFAPVNEWIFWLTRGPLFGRNLDGAQRWTSVWHIPQPQRYIVPWHPCPFPVALATRCITALTEPDDLICDPYSGAGTVGLAALETGRCYLGFERQPLYVTRSRTRLSAYTRPLALEAVA
jgi:site-specific DNA-methyltransferase (adenine-specific)